MGSLHIKLPVLQTKKDAREIAEPHFNIPKKGFPSDFHPSIQHSSYMNTYACILAIVEECKFDRIHVSLRRSFFKRAVRANLQLDDPNCIASVNETHFSFNIHHGTCGTLAKTTGSLVEISNYINYRTEGRQVFSVPVKCTYTKEKGLGSAVRAFQISHQEKYVSIWLGRKYHFNKKIVLDSSVSRFIEEIPLDIRASEDGGVLDVTISTVDDEMDFVIDHCKIKPSPSSQRERLLIINGYVSFCFLIFFQTQLCFYSEIPRNSEKGISSMHSNIISQFVSNSNI